MSSSEDKVELNRALTAKSLIATFILMIPLVTLSILTWLYTSKGEVIPVFTLPFFYVVLLNLVISKINTKIALSPSELLPLYFVLILSLHVGPVAMGGPILEWIEKTIVASGGMLMDSVLIPYGAQWVPVFMFPKSEIAVSAFYNGLQLGQSLPWGEYVTPIAFWSAYTILTYMFVMFLSFGVYGKRWVEVENLLFPHTVPTVFLIKSSADVDSETGKHRWFSFKNPEYRIFWICFAIGLLASLLPIMAQFFPILLPGTQEYGATPIEFPAMAAALPGTMARGTLQFDQMIIWMLLPVRSLATIIIVWLALGVIYPAVAVQAGWIPYQPGVEFRWSWDDTPGNWYPFPFETMWLGVLIGFGLLTIVTLRSRFKEMYEALIGKDKIENGLSLRTVTIMGIINIVLLFAIFVCVGVPPIIALLMLLSAFVVYTAIGKLSSIFWMHVADFIGWGGHSIYWTVGSNLGYWPANPSLETNTYAAFATASMHVPFNSCWTVRCNTIATGPLPLLKVAYELKANMKDILVATIIILITSIPFFFIFYVWAICHGGGITRTSSWGPWVQWWKYGFGLTGAGVGITGESQVSAALPWLGLGMITMFIVYAISLKFPGYWLDPAAFAFAAPYMDYNWLNAIVALIIKFIIIKVIGAPKFHKYVVAVSSGVTWGYGVPILIAWLIEFTSVIWPSFTSLYIP